MAPATKLQNLLNERDDIKKSSRLHWLHWLVVAASLILTLGAWQLTKSQVDERSYNMFVRESDQVVELITERLKTYEDILWSGVAAIHAQNVKINDQSWRRFATALGIEKKYSGINGIGVIYRLDGEEELNMLIEHERMSRPGFHVHPKHSNNEFWPIVYIEPSNINLKAIGLDMAHEENRFLAAQKARDSGKAQITGPIVLVQDSKKTPGFLFFAPFYNSSNLSSLEMRREHFVGMVYAPFVMNKLMKGTLNEEERLVGISIKDSDVTLYDENKPPSFNNERFFKKHEVNMYGRNWMFEIWAKESFFLINTSHKPIIILIGGILINSMLLAFFIFLTRSNKRALNFADNMAEGYRIKNDELRDAEIFQESVLSNIPDVIFVKDEKFRIVQANKAFLELYPEEKRDKVIGYTTLEEYDEHEANIFLKHDKEALDKGYSENLEKITFPNGKIETMHTKKIGFRDRNGHKFLIGVGHNITEIKKAEEELINSNLELERFAYVAAHDMQEPARIVKGFAEILEQDYLDNLDEQGQIYLKECINGARQIQNLINDLLEYSRLSNHSDAIDTVDMSSVLNSALNNLQNVIEETGADINYPDKLPKVKGNEMRCIRLIQNLISNAIKYQPDGQKPIIKISCTPQKSNYLFAIEDNGIGIDEKYHTKVFEPFKKLHHHSKYKGTGIGLSICKKIVQTMDGKLWLESELGKGSTFYFTLNKTNKAE